MAGNSQPEGMADDFFEQILSQHGYVGGGRGEMVGSTVTMMGLQLGSNNNNSNNDNNSMRMMPLGLNLEHPHGFLRHPEDVGGGALDINSNNASSSTSSATYAIISERDSLHIPNLFSLFGQLQPHSIPPPLPQAFHGQAMPGAASVAVPHVQVQQPPPAVRTRVRARRGQATDPHSIAERLRRVRITERLKALQQLVPTANKIDRAAMIDEIIEYVKFLRLQVKVLSMSRQGVTGTVAQLVADIPLSSVEKRRGFEGESHQKAWERWSNDGTEEQVAKLMEEDIGDALQFLQSKALCIMPVSLASSIFMAQPQMLVKPEANTPS